MLAKLAKDALRQDFIQRRKEIHLARREQASALAFTFLKQWIEDFASEKAAILSFAPFGDEIDIWPLNRWLMKERRLLLPRVHKKELHIYEVFSLQDLEIAPFGMMEPVVEKAKRIDPKEIDAAIVAGLVFDNTMHRLGYGLGYYDRLILSLRSSIPKIGIGFKEQLSQEPLPSDPHDQLLTHRFLF